MMSDRQSGYDYCNLTVDDVRAILAHGFHRCEVARNIGGIAHQDVVETNRHPGPGWELDIVTMYWIPPHVDLNALCAAKPN